MNFGILQIEGIHEQRARKREFFKTVQLIIILAEVNSRYDDLHGMMSFLKLHFVYISKDNVSEDSRTKTSSNIML